MTPEITIVSEQFSGLKKTKGRLWEAGLLFNHEV
jgi:hypothetical protein